MKMKHRFYARSAALVDSVSQNFVRETVDKAIEDAKEKLASPANDPAYYIVQIIRRVERETPVKVTKVQ